MTRYVLLFLFLNIVVLHAQNKLIYHLSNQENHVNIDSLIRDHNQNSGKQKNIIVEFKEDPMFIANMNSINNSINKIVSQEVYRSRFSEFASDIHSIGGLLKSSPANNIVIKHEYFRTFFGVSLTVPAEMLSEIQNLPYVKTIHYDREVQTYIEPGIALIGTQLAWNIAGTQGEGIRVGIIDSGIDYMHPALGGGFGTGFKVKAGYDFVNDDADPMDDNGHGTHVAGIVAANKDTVKGVAPNATLYAYKVLDMDGHGSESNIIEAIERTVDPNQDGDLSDKLDVVNMSLGSNEGSPLDPTSIAVNNAIKAGVVFCVAAGNAGGPTPVEGKEDNYFYDGSATIGSPGTAELAITVGASDLSDHLAPFSSKGPNRVSFGIKPEVLAPGVSINSTFLSSGYKLLSGTSMATPMITGVAALLKSIHPAWTPAMIKSAIVNTAKNNGLSAYLQGGGRVQALKSVLTNTLIIPSTLSFGMDDPSVGTWIKPETLYVYNKNNIPQLYNVAAGVIPAGITLNFSSSSFLIPANDSLKVIVTISVNNSQILIEDDNILRYTGSISFNGAIDTAKVPWAFTRANRLVITTSEPESFFIGYTNTSAIYSNDSKVSWVSPTRAEVYAPGKGIYEFYALFRNPIGKSKVVIKEGVPVNNNAAEVFLDGASAIHPLIYSGVDHQGNLLSSYISSKRVLITTLPNYGDVPSVFPGDSDTLLISGASVNHSFKPFEFQVDLASTKTFHIIQYDKFAGMSGGRTVTNNPGNFIQQHFNIKVPPGSSDAAQLTQFYNYKYDGEAGWLSGIGYDVNSAPVIWDEYTYTGYFGKSSVPLEDVAMSFYTSYRDVPNYSLDYESPLIMPYKDSIVATAREYVTPAVPRFENGATMSFGGSPVHLLMIWYNNITGNNSMHFRALYRGMLREDRYDDLRAGIYSLYNEEGENLFTKSLGEPREPLELNEGWYKLVAASSNYWLRKAKGQVTITSEFKLTNGEPANPPSITSFILLDDTNHPTDHFNKGDNAVLQFSVNITGFSENELPLFDSTKAWYRVHGTSQWKQLTITKYAELPDNEGLVVRASLDAALTEDSAAVDLRIFTKEENGYTLDYTISPAFAIGNWDTAATDVEDPGNGNLPDKFALFQNYPNPFNPVTTISYQVPDAGEISLRVYDILGREVAILVNEKKDAGSYKFEFNAGRFASGVYFYAIRSKNFVQTRKMILLK